MNTRRLSTLARSLVAVGLVLLVLGGGLAAVASPIPSVEYARPSATGGGGGGTAVVLDVNLTDGSAFQPSSLTAAAGATVTFDLHNVGAYAHSFTLSSVANLTLNRSWTPSQLDQFFARNASVNASVAPHGFDNVTLALNASWAGGSFEFVSIVPYQFQAGMSGFLNVTGAGGGAGVSITDQTATSALAFVPDTIVVNASAFPITVEIQVSNLGTIGHTWTLVAQPNVNVTPSGFSSYFQAHPPAVNLAVPTSPGVSVTGNFTLPARGAYMFLCEVPGHFAAGMFGFLYVGVPPPSVPQAPSTEVVAVWALAGAGGILGIGVALAVGAAYVGRFPPKSEPPGHP
ncbi:MAG TPA: plastocyanin/azurin family copper-binding protein [Thermoplasmata archaeon]|nr:plastocyanin/azurin family copper-binding protein [Thermoplasmata archaeon]